MDGWMDGYMDGWMDGRAQEPALRAGELGGCALTTQTKMIHAGKRIFQNSGLQQKLRPYTCKCDIQD